MLIKKKRKIKWGKKLEHIYVEKNSLQYSHCVYYLDNSECLEFPEWVTTAYRKNEKNFHH
jgi:hypothetical protein